MEFVLLPNMTLQGLAERPYNNAVRRNVTQGVEDEPFN